MPGKILPNAELSLTILHEDGELLVIDKAPGLPCYPLKENEVRTVANALVHHCPALQQVGGEFEAGIVHRLDNTTSGVLVVAKTQAAYERCRAVWNTEAVSKEYRALVLGVLPQKIDIGYPIAHHPKDPKRMIVCSNLAQARELKAREARTQATRLEMHTLAKDLIVSQARVEITTGVRHQIRVHLAFAGFPLLGDPLYGKAGGPHKRLPERFKRLRRPLLHLHRIEMPHPATGQKMAFASKGDPDFNF